MFKEAELVRILKNQAVQCRVCEHYCTLRPDEWGKCGVRVNRQGKIYLAVYGSAVAVHVDPIEKKPLFHFLPGSKAFSVGTYGCNMHCRWCQNWQISQVKQVDESHTPAGEALSPETIVALALRQHNESIAYTYNEPTVFFEYTYDTAKLAHARGLKNVYVSNGFMSPETLERLTPYLDGINVDLKGFTPALYEQYSGARLEPVKRNITAIAQQTNIWIEVTTLVIPGLNDSDEELRAAATWLASVNPEIPWHLSAFHPDYQMLDHPSTDSATLKRAYAIGKSAGLKFIYLGNVLDPEGENTVCPTCGEVLIQRYGYNVRPRWTTPGVCPKCDTQIPGVWN
ncbi:MAG TPA: AmmeMemoRadiSam system radical SAM enzyme [Anaerolineae bacterium]|nr:AmmeMemoRadiSam system radical SAM enzyme [Anaerolineae bacterium]HQH37672.1 AmmeMemoRadiSam system radical SAM enzyme [Anaerolineae bacterium]